MLKQIEMAKIRFPHRDGDYEKLVRTALKQFLSLGVGMAKCFLFFFRSPNKILIAPYCLYGQAL